MTVGINQRCIALLTLCPTALQKDAKMITPRRTFCRQAGAVFGLFASCRLFAETPLPQKEEQMFNFSLRDVVTEGEVLRHRRRSVQWKPSETAVIVCDMWDSHWCKGAASRVTEMAPELNRVLESARDKGAFIIHSPSSTVDFYEGTKQRKRAQEAPRVKAPVALSTDQRWGTAWCWPDKNRESPMPIDDSDMGCDCVKKCELKEAWTRQISSIEIHEDDAVTDDSQETYNLLEQRGIKHVVLSGVHLNMCVLGRPFGIRQMCYLGKQDVALMRDMTDTMYNSQRKPFVDHFTGTDLVVQHVERYWCPSILSSEIAGGSPFRFREDLR